jgi:hypothetical protein
MSRQRKITIRICKRAVYFLFNNSSETSKVLRNNSNDITTLRKLITRCYQIS